MKYNQILQKIFQKLYIIHTFLDAFIKCIYMYTYNCTNPYVATFLSFPFDPKDKMAEYTGALLEILMNS